METQKRQSLIGCFRYVALICLFAMPLHVNAQDRRPIIGISFKIEGQSYRDNFSDKLPEIETEVVAALIKFCEAEERFFPYVRLRPLNEAQNVRGRLELRLIMEEGLMNPEVLLVYSMHTLARSGAEHRFTLYGSLQLNQRTQDPEGLKTDIIGAVKGHLGNEGFRKKKVEKRFLMRIPLVTQIGIPEAAEQRLVIPLNWKRIRPATRSIFYVMFKAKNDSNTLQPGNMNLSPEGEVYEGDWAGMIQCRLKDPFSYPSVTDTSDWGQIIPVLRRALDRDEGGVLHVFMHHYEEGNSFYSDDDLIYDLEVPYE